MNEEAIALIGLQRHKNKKIGFCCIDTWLLPDCMEHDTSEEVMSLNCPRNPTPFIEPTLFTRTCFWTLYWVKMYPVQNIEPRYCKTHISSRSKTCEKRPLASSCLSACHSVRMNNSASTRHIFMIFDISGFFENPSRKLTFLWSLTRLTCTLHEDRYMYIYDVSLNSS